MATVGIDLGTTNTVVGCVRDGKAVTLADDAGRRLIPSVVSFHPSGSVLVGAAAKDRRVIDAPNTIFSVKRLIGRAWTTPEVQESKKRFPFELKEGAKQGVAVTARGEQYTLPEISAFVLRHAKAVAEKALGEPVERAVITVPANFNDLQRAATKVAGKLAGLEVLRILNEPTAAAVAYGQQGLSQSERIAIYDLGGGTFDITILDLTGSVYEVLATAGDMQLGGDDLDHAVAQRMAEACMKQHRFDPRADPVVFGTLLMVAESIKRDLSSLEETQVEVPDLVPAGGGKSPVLTFKMTRTEFQHLALPFIDRTFATCQVALDSAQIKVGAISRTILVGGSTRMPILVKRVEEFFKKPPFMRINPDEVVALGASIQASALDRTVKRTEPSAGKAAAAATKAASHAPAPPAATPAAAPPAGGRTITAPGQGPTGQGPAAPPPTPDFGSWGPPPAEVPPTPFAAPTPPPPGQRAPAQEEFPTFIKAPAAMEDFGNLFQGLPEGKTGGHAPLSAASLGNQWDMPMPEAQMSAPEEVAPLQRAATPLLIDVTPLSLSVETVGDFCDVLITRNTPVPCDKTRVFSTVRDGQTSVAVRVAQGEENRFSKNTYLGELELSGIPAARRGEAQIAVTFELDADGILNVKAKDQTSGREQNCKIHLVGAHDGAEVDAMMKRQAQKALG